MLSSIKEYQPEPQISPSIWMTLGLPSRGTRVSVRQTRLADLNGRPLIRDATPFFQSPATSADESVRLSDFPPPYMQVNVLQSRSLRSATRGFYAWPGDLS
jgi:hypothetical protein